MSAKYDKFLSKLVEKQSGGSGTANPVTWDDVTGKPSNFPPADHGHEISDVNGLQSALDSKGTVKSVNGTSPDSSGNVVLETGGGGGESSGFPDDASDGDVMMFQTAIDRGNSASTKLLIQPETGDGTLIDQAYGNAAPITIRSCRQ